MFYRINNSEFGKYIKQLRIDKKYSQKKLAEEASISDETIRRLEKGKYMPSISTLHNLSRVLKVDLIKANRNIGTKNVLNYFYSDLDDLIINNNREKLMKITNYFKECELKVENTNVSEIKEFEQFKKLLEGLELSYENEYGSEEACVVYEEALRLTNPEIYLNSTKDYSLSYLEMKCLLLFSLEKNSLNKYEESNVVSLSLLKYINNSLVLDIFDSIIFFKIKLILNIAYNYHGLDKDKEALKYATLGIEYCLKNKTFYLLHGLFYRKAVAQYFLKENKEEIKFNFGYSIFLLELQDMHELKEIYIKITKETYNIDIKQNFKNVK